MYEDSLFSYESNSIYDSNHEFSQLLKAIELERKLSKLNAENKVLHAKLVEQKHVTQRCENRVEILKDVIQQLIRNSNRQQKKIHDLRNVSSSNKCTLNTHNSFESYSTNSTFLRLEEHNSTITRDFESSRSKSFEQLSTNSTSLRYEEHNSTITLDLNSSRSNVLSFDISSFTSINDTTLFSSFRFSNDEEQQQSSSTTIFESNIRSNSRSNQRLMQSFIISDIRNIISEETIKTEAKAIIANDIRNVTSMLSDYDFEFVDNAVKDFILYLKEANIMHFSD